MVAGGGDLPPVLVAEDDADARRLFVRFFAKMMLANPAVLARDGNEALDYLRRAEEGRAAVPAAVLLDLHMPGRSGLELLRWVRDSATLRDVPVVMLTGSAELDAVNESYELGVASYLVKPVGFTALNEVLRGLPGRWALVPPGWAPAAGGVGGAERDGRRVFAAALRDRLAGGRPGVLLLRVASLRAINEVLGHDAGDALLAAVGERLAASAGAGDVAARLDGAGFGLLVDGDGPDRLDDLAHRLRDRLQEAVTVAGNVLHPVVDVGVTRAGPDDGVDEVLCAAEAALEGARSSGSGCQHFDPRRHLPVVTRRRLEIDLQAAPSRGELVLHYQPVVDLRDNHLVGVEALVRWQRPGEDLVMPGEFIAIAEESGAIRTIGLWVLEEACRQVLAWNRRYRPTEPLHVGVNVSVRQLSGATLPGEVAEILDRVGIPAGQVNLEVTESSLMDDADEMIRRLEELRGIGVTLSMDDFGTGYSSLSYLRRLPVDVVKIDRSFVDGIARTDEEWGLAVAIVKMATGLGKRTLAEGIETPAQVAHLRALHCELGQGYLFGRPLAPADFEDALRAGRP